MIIKTQFTQSLHSSRKLAKILRFAGQLQYLRVVKQASFEELGAFTRDNLANLGSTFIKIGQLLSTRSDLLDKRFTSQLSSLQDRVPAFDISSYREDIDRITVSFDEVPIASASIGQVHKAILNNGDVVAIKLKRPDIAYDIDTDFQMLLGLIGLLRRIQDRRELFELETVFKQYKHLLNEEIDFVRELNNLQYFKNIFSSQNVSKWIQIPLAYPALSSNDIIVMEYLPAIKINDFAKLDQLGFDRALIANKLVECYIKQIVEYGKVHIDPHPGNVGITENGKIVFYDYGMVTDINPTLMTKFEELLIAVSEKDTTSIARLLVETDIVSVNPENMVYLKSFVVSFLTYIETVDLSYVKENFIDKIGGEDLPFIINSNFLLILRGLTILEGVCKSLDPNFSYKKVIDPYINENIGIDLLYIEKKVLKDIQKFNFTQLMSDTQKNDVDKELLEKKVNELNASQTQKQTQQSLSNIIIVFLLIVVGWNERVTDNVFVQIGLATITFLSLYNK